MTVSELIAKLKDCAPNAEVAVTTLFVDGKFPEPLTLVKSDGERVVLS